MTGRSGSRKRGQKELYSCDETPTICYASSVIRYPSCAAELRTSADGRVSAAVGLKRWNTLPPDVRKILEDTAKETQAYVYAQGQKEDDELRAKLAASGMKVNQVDKDAFIATSKTIYEEFGKEVPGSSALIDKAIALGK